MIEGSSDTQEPLYLEIHKNDSDENPIALFGLQISISSVLDMFRFHNIRLTSKIGKDNYNDRNISSKTNEPPNLPDYELDNIDLFLAHGFLVEEDESFAWGSEFFKRFWHEGSRARFNMVTWTSDEGGGLHYEENVYNAFLSATNYASLLRSIKDEKNSKIVLLAHSLGNMLTSAAIQDYNAPHNAYFALNAAVPAEAYDANLANIQTNEFNFMLHSDWRGYASRTWAAEYHKLFEDETLFPNDDRRKLTWRGRFCNVVSNMYNYWSSGDEVLEIKDISQSDLYVMTGVEYELDWSWHLIDPNPRRYTWQKQAHYKGCGFGYGSTWAGWGFDEYWFVPCDAPSAEEANSRDLEQLRADPIFDHDPDELFSSTISKSRQHEILAHGVPELSYPIGYMKMFCVKEDLDMHDKMRREDRKWPNRSITFDDEGTRPKRWLHTDLINVAYFYTFNLYKTIVETGELK